MARNQGITPFSANFEPQAAAPLDARMYVETKADLTNPDTWKALDDNQYTYKGMIVAVHSDTDPSNNGIYVLVGDDPTVESNWKVAGAVTEDDLQWINKTNELDDNTNQLEPKDPKVKRVKVKQDENGGTMLHLENTNTGNNAYASVVATTDSQNYTDQLFFAKLGSGYWVSEFAGNAILTTDKTLYVGHYGSGALKLYTADQYQSPITRLEISSGYLKINDDDGNPHTRFTNGKIGIYTDDPQRDIHIKTPAGTPAAIRLSRGDNTKSAVFEWDTNDSPSASQPRFFAGLPYNKDYFSWSRYDGTNVYTDMIIDTNGKVGISNDNPAAQLTIGESSEIGALSVQDTTNGAGNIYTFRDKNGENISKAKGNLEDDNLYVALGDYDESYNRGTLSLDKDGLYYGPTPSNQNDYWIKSDKNGNTNIYNTLTTARIGLKTNSDPTATTGAIIQLSNKDISFKPGNIERARIGEYGKTYFDTEETISLQAHGVDQIIIRENEGRPAINAPSYTKLRVISDADAIQYGSDHIVYFTNLSTTRTYTLSSTPSMGTEIIIKVDDSVSAFGPTLRIDGNGNKIDGNDTLTISTARGKVRLYFTGKEWLNI